MAKRFKIHPNVISCNSRKGVLTDKTRSYPEIFWKEGEADKLVKDGHLIVDQPGAEIVKTFIDNDRSPEMLSMDTIDEPTADENLKADIIESDVTDTEENGAAEISKEQKKVKK